MAKEPQDHQSSVHRVKIGGTSYALKAPKAGLLRRVRKRDPLDLMFTLFEECGDADFLAALDELDTPELNPIFTEWMGALGGGDAGKSGGSSS